MIKQTNIDNAAQRRMKDTLDEQKRVYREIRNGSPLNAEDDTYRKIAFLSRKMNVSRDSTRQIVDKADLNKLNLTPSQRSKAESIQGDSIDFMGIQFLDLAIAASKAIARVTFLNGEPQGTGFMVSPRLFLTNNHVISSRENAKEFLLEFNYQLNYQRNPLALTRFELDPDSFFITFPQDDLDFTLVAVGKKTDGPLLLEHFGFLPLINTEDKHIKAIFVNCVQHPNGMFKQLVVRENRLLDRTENTLIYSSDTLPGASGSPVFNDDWEVLALHHWGEPYRAFIDLGEVPDGFPKVGNEGIRISSIYKILQAGQGLTEDELKLLSEVLNPSSRYPSIIGSEPANPQPENLSHVNKRKNFPMNQTISNVSENGVSFTIPLTVTIQIGNAQQFIPELNNALNPAITKDAAEKNNTAITAPGAEALRPDPNYSNRKGYNPDFLGKRIPMPKLNAVQLAVAAKNRQAGTAENSVELKYQYFSIVMNGKRRLPFFTAVNIDGGSVVKINRETGQVTRHAEAMEGREKWFDDDRIEDDEISHDSLYMQSEMKIFQRGHLVKRTDPSWGTDARAIKGQADTFHFTNCSPQHYKFNPIKSRWAGIEDWITNTSDDDNLRVSVFSGPVFKDNDRKIDYLQIPRQYWKVVIWVEDDKLHATGVIADQGDLLDAEWLRPESLNSLPDRLPEEYHCSIKYLERETGLDFGLPENTDTYSNAESIAQKRKVNEFVDILPRRKLRENTH